jgi:hypothetical protein
MDLFLCRSYSYIYRIFYQYNYCEFTDRLLVCKGKVKQSRNRPGVAQRVPGGVGSKIFMTFGT